MPTPTDAEWADLKRSAGILESGCPRPPEVDLEAWLYEQLQLLQPLPLSLGVTTYLIELAYLELVADFVMKGG